MSVIEPGAQGEAGGFVGFVGDSVQRNRDAMLAADPFLAWRHRNGERLTDADRRLGHDGAGFCVEHRRWLSHPEQRRGACSWCVPVDPESEPDYWQTHWRRFTEDRRDGGRP